MQRVLITGGAGFIGSHLCECLLASGVEVRVLDDLSTGKLENLPDRVDFHLGDVGDLQTVRAALAGIDVVFHLAAIASVERSVNDWRHTHQVNQSATINVFEAIRQTGRAIPVVYASSAAVYGACTVSPITEDAPKRPLSAYGADKLGCELHAAVAGHVHGIPSTGLRFFNVYGPRQDPRSPYSGVISIFAERLLKGQTISIHGDGQQSRDFIYVEDVVRALIAAARVASLDAEVFNVCTGRATTVLQLAELLSRLSEGRTRPDWQFSPARPGDARSAIGSPQRTAARLGVPTPIYLEEGLPRVLNWMRTY